MIKYHVKFSHMIQLPNHNQTNIPTKITYVEGIYRLEPHVDIFAYIHSKYNVVGSITVIKELEDKQISEVFYKGVYNTKR